MRLLGLAILMISSAVFGQDLPSATSLLDQTELDRQPWATARSAAMAGALAPVANEMDSFFHNPAAIGGIDSKAKQPKVSQIHFPFFSLAAATGSIALNQSLAQSDQLGDSSVINEILANSQDKHLFARASVVPNVVFKRAMFGYLFDTQVAGATLSGVKNNIRIQQQTDEGPIFGFSLADGDGRYFFGLSAGVIDRTVVSGDFEFSELNNPQTRKSLLKANQLSYQGLPINLGSLWRFKSSWKPALALVVNDLSNTRFRPRDLDRSDLVTEEQVTLGFSLSPKFGMIQSSMIIEAEDITNDDKSLEKLFKVGLETGYGKRFGGHQLVSLRAGYGSGGLSYGFGLNLGILSLNGSSSGEDVGVNDNRVIERRTTVNFAVNVADF